MKIKTEIYCHECGNYVQFTLDKELDGNHIIKCPKCGHEHCRVIKNGEVTHDRWDSRNGDTYYVNSYSTVTFSSSSWELSYTGNSVYLYNSWSTANTYN